MIFPFDFAFTFSDVLTFTHSKAGKCVLFCSDLVLAVHIVPTKNSRESGCLPIGAIGLASHYVLEAVLRCRMRAGD